MVEQFQCLCINVIRVTVPRSQITSTPRSGSLGDSGISHGYQHGQHWKCWNSSNVSAAFQLGISGPPDILMMLEVSHQLHYLEPISAYDFLSFPWTPKNIHRRKKPPGWTSSSRANRFSSERPKFEIPSMTIKIVDLSIKNGDFP